MSDSNAPWWAVTLAAVATALIGLFPRWRESMEKKAERESVERDRVRANLDSATLAYVQRTEANYDRERARREELETERDKLERELDKRWDLVRAWRDRCADCRHQHNGLMQVLQSAVQQDMQGEWKAIPPLPDINTP